MDPRHSASGAGESQGKAAPSRPFRIGSFPPGSLLAFRAEPGTSKPEEHSEIARPTQIDKTSPNPFTPDLTEPVSKAPQRSLAEGDGIVFELRASGSGCECRRAWSKRSPPALVQSTKTNWNPEVLYGPTNQNPTRLS